MCDSAEKMIEKNCEVTEYSHQSHQHSLLIVKGNFMSQITHDMANSLWALDHHSHMCLLKSSPLFTAVTASAFLGILSTRFWSVAVGICTISRKSVSEVRQ